jgi:hypothetical protein
MKRTPTVLNRLILPVLFVVCIAGAFEIVVDLKFRPGFWQKTTWLLHDPYRGEIFDRSELYLRLSHLEDSEPDIISVGDSSGFFSLQSTIVNRYTHGLKFISFNTGANQAYIGYQGIAEYMLQRSHHIKYVVLYVYPQLLPQGIVFAAADLGPITYDDLVSVKSYVTPPSAFLSPYGKYWLFEGRHFHVDEPVSYHLPSLQLQSTVDDSLGWLPEFDVRYDRIDGRSTFYPDTRWGWYNHLGLTESSSINASLDEFANAVSSYNAQLVIAFAPISERALFPGDPNVATAEQALARFQQEHPAVKFLFPLITRWSIDKFGMYNHISREYTFLSSERLGKALGRLVDNPDSIPPFAPQSIDSTPYPLVAARPLGPPDPTLLEPALALYLYTQTADPSHLQHASKRVLDLLANEPSYQYMMADAQARLASLSHRNIKLGFDLSQLRATPVEITGLAHCDSRPDLQWVQLDGAMIFTFASPTASAREPVLWPQGSHIYVPMVVEDGTRKFDGYCPEPSMNGTAVAMQ